MNDSELRRRELLKQTRRLYQDSADICRFQMEQNHLKPADISSTQIVNEIQKEIPGNGMDFISRIKLY